MLIRDLAEIARQGRRYRAAALEPYGLTHYHASFLPAIDEHPGLSQDQLAQLLCMNKSNVARRIATLEEEGLVHRTPSSRDRRVMEVSLTEKARALLPVIRHTQQTWDEYLRQDMTPEEQALLARLLSHIRDRAVSWKEDPHE